MLQSDLNPCRQVNERKKRTVVGFNALDRSATLPLVGGKALHSTVHQVGGGNTFLTYRFIAKKYNVTMNLA